MDSKLNSLIGCLNDSVITRSNYKEQMLTTHIPFSIKKWFLTHSEELVDLNSFTSIRIEKNANSDSEKKFLVVSDGFDVLGCFETVDECKAYIKHIHIFLVAQ